MLVRFQVDLRSRAALVLLANSITLTPGTITVEAGEESFVVHALDASLAQGIEGSSFVKLLVQLEHWGKSREKGAGGQ